MIDLDYYKIIASNETELSPKGFEFKIILRELIADVEREQKESVPAETQVIASEQRSDLANGAVADEKLILNWEEGRLIDGDPAYILDDCHGVSINNYVDHIEIKFYQRVKENGKTYCRITKKYILDVAKLAEALKLLDE